LRCGIDQLRAVIADAVHPVGDDPGCQDRFRDGVQQLLNVLLVRGSRVPPVRVHVRRDDDRGPVVDTAQGILGRGGQNGAAEQPPARVILRQGRVRPELVETREDEQVFLGVEVVRDLLPVPGLLPLVAALGRARARRLMAALRNEGLSRIVSLRALVSFEPILRSLAQDGTRPERAIRSRRSTESSSSVSVMIGSSCVGATFPLGGGGLSSVSGNEVAQEVAGGFGHHISSAQGFIVPPAAVRRAVKPGAGSVFSSSRPAVTPMNDASEGYDHRDS
jgi:hypothetical protein